MGQVVFLPRPENNNIKIIILNKILMSAPKWDGLILARKGGLADYKYITNEYVISTSF